MSADEETNDSSSAFLLLIERYGLCITRRKCIRTGIRHARYERGEREPDCVTLKQLSKFFGVSIDYILYNDWETQSDLLIF